MKTSKGKEIKIWDVGPRDLDEVSSGLTRMKWPIFGKITLNIFLWNQKAKLNLVLVCSIRDVSASNFAQMMILAYGTLTDIQVAAVRWSGNREL